MVRWQWRKLRVRKFPTHYPGDKSFKCKVSMGIVWLKGLGRESGVWACDMVVLRHIALAASRFTDVAINC